MSRTSIMRANGVRDSTEEKVTENYAVTLAKNLNNAEAAARAAADRVLDGRLKDVEEIAHDHDNKDLLDGITAEDIELWNDGGRNKLNATLATPEMIDEMMKNATPDVTVPDGITIGLATREQVEKIFDE